MSHAGSGAITEAIRHADGPALCAFVTAGFPSRTAFPDVLRSVAAIADVVEIGVPFSDPMADGLTIQRASSVALADGVSVDWILETVGAEAADLDAPCLFMGYYNPFLAYGLDRLGASLATARVSGLIVPDLPLEEASPLRAVLDERSQALVQLVTPTTPDRRLGMLAGESAGFVYAVTTTGVTGGSVELSEDDIAYLKSVKDASSIPVLAGFGVREREQVEALAKHVDGVIVGSALIDTIEQGQDPGVFLEGLRLPGLAA